MSTPSPGPVSSNAPLSSPERQRQEVLALLSGFGELDEPDKEALAGALRVQYAEKNTLLVREGQICRLCYFVLSGCLRQYLLRDGVEKTTAFYTNYQAVNFFTSVTSQIPSETNLATVEDSLLLVGDPVTDAALYSRFPQLEQITRRMMETDFGRTQDAFSHFRTSSPEERYLQLLKERPDLFQRVPLQQIASYLGITPESLSRLRKRIARR